VVRDHSASNSLNSTQRNHRHESLETERHENLMHPHPNKAHVVSQYRRHILSSKRKFGSARALIHYRQILETYLWAKR
jgi:hypothetical protein